MNEVDCSNCTCKMGGATFLIRIYFKQNANWQGTVQWLETNKTIPFRSSLELMFLLNEAVEKMPTTTGELDFRSWEDMGAQNFYTGKDGGGSM